MTDTLQANQEMHVGDRLVPPNGKSYLIMQPDGNLVLYRTDNNYALWASNTWQKPVTHAIMQTDGNFVCYDDSGRAFWATGTNDHPDARVTLQDDGNLVVYDRSGRALWASNTVINWAPKTFDTGDKHLDTGKWMHSWAEMSNTGLISGHTRIWTTNELTGFHGSVLPLLAGSDGKVIWPSNPDRTKLQYGVNGTYIRTAPSDRTIYWAIQVDAVTAAEATQLTCIQYEDPKGLNLQDIPIIAQTVAEVAKAIATVASVAAVAA